jgi:hypothetical protein
VAKDKAPAKKKQVEIKPVEPEIKAKNKGGRPTDYTVELGIKFCRALVNFSSVEECCKSSDEFPVPSTIWLWMLDYVEFSEGYKKANKIRAYKFAEACLPIADDDSNDLLTSKLTGEQKCNTTAVTRSALRVNTRFNLAKKFNPEMFGDKIEPEKTPDETPKSLDEINNKINTLLLNALTKNEQ